PLAAHNPPHRLHVSSQIPPILMVNATHDPSTAYVWAEGLHRQLPHSVLLTRRGDGHTGVVPAAQLPIQPGLGIPRGPEPLGH
ncbi:MAG TPA: alpha/beta hydrolase, partial [Solirubrobacteraceae bacterium]|nr:alpha/beta hydrolase [Solirubrobacteraceae bacterium]